MSLCGCHACYLQRIENGSLKKYMNDGWSHKRIWTPTEIESIGPGDICEKNKNHHCYTKQITGDSESGGVDWWGIKGGSAKVKKLGIAGWPEGVNKAIECLGTLTMPFTKSIRRERLRGPSGDDLDIHKIMRGQFDRAWEKRKRQIAPGIGLNVTRIAVSVGANCSVDASRMFWRGAVAIILSDALEASGRSCEIVAFDTGYNSYNEEKMSINQVNVKEAGDYLDIERVSLILCLAGYFRLHFFNAILAHSEEASGGLGQAIELYPIDDVRPGDIIITDVWSKEDAIKFIAMTMECFEQGSAVHAIDKATA